MTVDDAVSLEGVTKRFGPTVALNGVTMRIPRGGVHAVLGENGAGKSTLIKLLSGIVRPDEGVVRVMGETVRLIGPKAAQAAGIATAFQELSLVPDLTVAQNLTLVERARGFSFRSKAQARARASEMLSTLDLSDIDPRSFVRELDLGVRQRLEIASAISRKPDILLLDEPTSALTTEGVAWLGRQIRECERRGVTVVLITHRMREVREWCLSLSILRNGACVGSFESNGIDDAEVFRLIMGRTLGSAFPPRLPPPLRTAAPRLKVTGLSASQALHDISFEIRAGECLGVVALQGMGQLRLFKTLFGLTAPSSGEIQVDGRRVSIRSPRDAIAANVGLSLVPEDRKTEGLAMNLSGRANISLPTIERFARWGRVDRFAERVAVTEALRRVSGNLRALDEPASAFSGGNQQKFVIAKWLMADSRVLLLFDPTRGVDVGAKFEIYQVMHGYLEAGGAVLLHSTEIPEVANLADRILVMYAGRIVAELDGRSASEHDITMAMMGTTVQPEALSAAGGHP
jgi:ribose transport system ATP-binding protein